MGQPYFHFALDRHFNVITDVNKWRLLPRIARHYCVNDSLFRPSACLPLSARLRISLRISANPPIIVATTHRANWTARRVRLWSFPTCMRCVPTSLLSWSRSRWERCWANVNYNLQFGDWRT